ncbi:flagellar L-ring protein precursor FlgH [Candidatus Gastranaerophilus sp. (ex Termes propinquus)]|nr:flagellar L-ring protein precursor FlgH [Candidatus Gastranaerophilus sp. (ex Termes propinquus)]
MRKLSLVLIICALVCTAQSAQAESLFSLNATQMGTYIEPKPLYGSIRAKGVGDLLTIIISEAPTLADKGVYQTEKKSSLAENIIKTVNNVFETNLKTGMDGLDGKVDVKGTTTVQRQMQLKDSVAVQVVQVMPNGNLLVQGKKTLVNANERMDMLVSGMVDPRWINQAGEINSRNVANLQFAASGTGTVSRGQHEGIFTRFFRMIF